ncbi:MAG TPA: hypothetical protein VGX46_03500 [Vicinamibacterales bacterium]|jgi:hypothetical protein|nr:hypothetical protein [Vicinamibacterales bacterium]
MTRRVVVLTLIASLGGSSLAFAGESLLQSGLRIAREVGRVSVTLPAADARTALTDRAGRLASRLTPERAEALDGQGAPALATSPMRKRTKILIYVAAGVGFGAAAYAIDHKVLNITPSTLGTRKD